LQQVDLVALEGPALVWGIRVAYLRWVEESKRGTMNADVLKGKWKQLKGDVKSRWGQLTDDDLDRVSGDVEKLVGQVQERYGYARDRAKNEVDDFINSR
jgi:uncharacterized protein YjbJ (UPF0337 family)